MTADAIFQNMILLEESGARYELIPAGESIGHDLERDRRRFAVTEKGVVVVQRHFKFY